MAKPAVGSQQPDRGALHAFVSSFSRWSVRWVPDAMVFVLALTVIVFLMAWGLTKHGPLQLVDDWVKGFWVLLTFAMQMCVLMITGFTVADSKYVKNGINKLIDIPKTRNQTILMYFVFISILWYLHWGIGMMTSIIMGRQLAVRKRGLGLDYIFIAAISYCAIVLTNGPSMAAQLLLATPGHFMEKVTGVIPISLTTFHPQLLLTNLIMLLTAPFIMLAVAPSKENSVEISEELAKEFTPQETPSVKNAQYTPAERRYPSPGRPILIAVIGVFWIGKFIATKGIGSLDLNVLNFIFFMLGLLLHGSANSFMASVQRGVVTVGGVIVQFPLYAGIFGIISFSGLATIIADWFVSISTAYTFPFIVFIYSGFLNLFVPSGGSKFVIEAPYILPAAKKLGASMPMTINAYTYGDLWTNLIQPFWALPILGAFKLRFQDILPYGFMMLIWAGIVITFGLLALPLVM